MMVTGKHNLPVELPRSKLMASWQLIKNKTKEIEKSYLAAKKLNEL